MRTIIAVVLLINLWVGFSLYVLLTPDQMPGRVATHFTFRGDADGWMDRSTHVTLMLAMGWGMPLLILGISYLARFCPRWMLNLPYRNYWLAPEREDETVAYLFRQSIWVACLLVGLFIGIHYSIINANQQNPPHLTGSLAFSIIGGFVAFMLVWMIALVRHFRRVT